MRALLYPHENSRNNVAIQFTVSVCCKCRVPFAVTSEHYGRLSNTGEVFYCPAGHPQHFTETTESKLKKEVSVKEREISRLEYLRKEAEETAEKSKRREQIAIGETKRIVGRVSSGVCPCCNRFFDNVARHMKTKHPDQNHEPFSFTELERRFLAHQPMCLGAKQARRRFIGAHFHLSDEQIARLMIDGKIYSTTHLPTVAKAVAHLRTKIQPTNSR